MKERNLLFFITAVTLSTLVIVSLLVRTQIWFALYGNDVVPNLHKLLIPVALIWVGFYFENKYLLLAATILTSVLFMFHLDAYKILSDFVPTLYAPIVRTVFVLTTMLLAAVNGLGYYVFFKLDQKKQLETK